GGAPDPARIDLDGQRTDDRHLALEGEAAEEQIEGVPAEREPAAARRLRGRRRWRSRGRAVAITRAGRGTIPPAVTGRPVARLAIGLSVARLLSVTWLLSVTGFGIAGLLVRLTIALWGRLRGRGLRRRRLRGRGLRGRRLSAGRRLRGRWLRRGRRGL